MYDAGNVGMWAELVSALSALGCLAWGVSSFLGDRHKKRDERINRIAVELRYTQKSANPPIRPFYEGDL